ncbi:MAG: ABC transporter ATP-binding protein [SAR324 cluster bacterium]|nr:ABC transporter ATP-binding protein [SAR324 cluster bacterium]
MIHIASLGYRFGSRVALDGVTFGVAAGELFGLLGPNGSGKSTLLRILTSLRRPSQGEAAIDGCDVASRPAEVRRRLGVAFQSPSLDKKLSVEENMRFQGYLFGMRGRALAERVDELLENFGLQDRRRERAETLSGGLKRRVELAKALLHGPRVLLLDEPSTGLDPAARRDFWDVLGAMRGRNELTVLVATHLMDEAERCDRVALLDQGRLVALGKPGALKDRIGGETVSVETAQPALLAKKIEDRLGLKTRLAGESVRVDSPDAAGTARKLLDAFGAEVQAVRVGRPTLEDVFLTLTGRGLDAGEEEAP